MVNNTLLPVIIKYDYDTPKKSHKLLLFQIFDAQMLYNGSWSLKGKDYHDSSNIDYRKFDIHVIPNSTPLNISSSIDVDSHVANVEYWTFDLKSYFCQKDISQTIFLLTVITSKT